MHDEAIIQMLVYLLVAIVGAFWNYRLGQVAKGMQDIKKGMVKQDEKIIAMDRAVSAIRTTHNLIHPDKKINGIK